MKQLFLPLFAVVMTMVGYSQNPIDSLSQPCTANLTYSVSNMSYDFTLDATDGTSIINSDISWSVNGIENNLISSASETLNLTNGINSICATYNCDGLSNTICISVLVDGNGGGNPLDSIGNGGGNPLDSIGNGGGNPLDSIGNGGGNPLDSIGNGGGNPLDSIGNGGGNPLDSIGNGGGNPLDSIGNGGGNPLDSIGNGGGNPLDSIGNGGGNPLDSIGNGGGNPLDSIGNGGGNPLDSIGNGGGNPLDSIGNGGGNQSDSIVIDGIEFDEWFDNNWDSVVVDEELLDEVEEWDITEWSDSLIDLVFGNDVDVDDDIDSDDTYVISDSLDQNEMDSLLGTGVVTFTNDDLDDMWEDFLEENDFDGTNTSFDDLLEQFGEYVEEKAQSALSITDISESSLSVYFNTNNSVLTIESEVVNQVSVFNINGQNVYNVNTKSNQIDLSSLNSGIYVLILEIEGKPYTQKIVK